MNTPDFSRIPSKESLLESVGPKTWAGLLGRPYVSHIIDTVLTDLKDKASSAAIPAREDILGLISDRCRAAYRRRVIRVINGTGVLLHTNMGRSPIAEEVWDACRATNTSFSNLEFNLETGKRGRRNGIVPRLLSFLTGAQASMVVNNNAAAVFLVLSALAKDKEVLVSRGEQVQIGGGFRIPDILALSGARLVEVGTTNITTLEDYERALSENTACVLSVHRSNFAIRGFTAQPSLEEIKRILPEGVFLFVDQGSGTLTETIKGETGAERILKDGADLISFSCDKVLGGPQGGIIAGRSDLIASLERHQLYRVFRPGKTVYSLLEETLVRRINGGCALGDRLPPDRTSLENRASLIAAGLPAGSTSVVSTLCSSGGGSSPDETYPSAGLRFDLSSPDRFLERLRGADIPVIGYISEGSVFIDLVAIDPADDALLTDTLRQCLGDAQ